MTIPYGTTVSNLMHNKNSNDITEKSPSRFSYLIRPATPCVFGTEFYDDKVENDDEFFVTAGGIVHSCPNIYELSIKEDYEPRKFHSCNHFMFIYRQTTSVNTHLNTYDTESTRYSILPRFQFISTSPSPSLSNDSINSELALYKQRHELGLSRKSHPSTLTNSSFFPKTWKSDNHLLLMPIQRHQLRFSASIGSNKRLHSNNISTRQTFSSLFS